MGLIDILRPTGSKRVYDTVEEAGISVAAWHNVSPKITPAQNPSFCYRWAFEGEGKILLFLWYSEVTITDDAAEYFGNARQARNIWEERANDQRDRSVKRRLKTWSDSAQQMDQVLKLAHWENREVRVALVHTKKSVLDEDERSSADYRMLDPEPWSLVSYEMQDGSFHLRRGVHATADAIPPVDIEPEAPGIPVFPDITPEGYGIGIADQFAGSESPGRNAVAGFEWERSPKVRQFVLARSGGCCEYCGAKGFEKVNGDLYLETHHAIALSDGGADTVWNVIALCPGHHREAHYGINAAQLTIDLLQILAGQDVSIGAA